MKAQSRGCKNEREFFILSEAVENTNEAFVTIDQHHRVIFFNKAAEKIFGYCRDEVIGEDLNTLISPRCSPDHRRAVMRYVETRKPTLIGHESEFTAVRKNGETFPAAISFSVAESDGALFFTALIRDLTETKILQEQIARSERLAALGQVVAEITHEIKNPLMLIGGFARRLGKSVTDQGDQEKLKIIVNEVERLEHLLMGLREIYLPLSMSFAQLDINELLNEVHQLTMELCQTRGIQLSLMTEEMPRIILGDREKLKQVLLNVIRNAVEAIVERGVLIIQSATSGGTVEVLIHDSGPGIAKENLVRIFTPFFTTKKEGSGLGLSVCKRIIDEHKQCSLDITSEEGKGTVVRLSFPLYCAEMVNPHSI